MLDLLAVGDATIDAFLTLKDNNHFALSQDRTKLCIDFGGKIPLSGCSFQLGGNACNVAVGIARLKLSAALCAETGNDEFAQKIVNGLQKEQVDLSYLLQTPGEQASFAIGLNFQQDRTLFVDHVQRAHQFQLDGVLAKWIYLTSMGHEWRKPYHYVLDIAKEKHIPLAFAPGTLQLAEGGSYLSEIIAQSAILFVNKKEAVKISNIKNQISKIKDEEAGIKELLYELKEMGAGMVVITDGRNGAYVIEKDGTMYAMPILDHPVVERTGAGDAFAAGFLAALLYGKDVPEAMLWGTVNAGSVVGSIGAQAGLLTKEAIEREVARCSIVAKAIQ